MKQDEEFSIQILGHEWVLQPRQGFGGVLQRTLPKELKDMTQRGEKFSLKPTEGAEEVTSKDYGIRILLQVLTAGPCLAVWPKETDSSAWIGELHRALLEATPPQALEFELTEKSLGLNLYLYPENVNRDHPSGGSREEHIEPCPVFLGFIVAEGALKVAHECIQSSRLPLVLDLDETVVKAYTASKLTKEIDGITNALAWHAAEHHPRMQREIEFLKEDRELVQQFCSSGSVAIDGKTYNARWEEVCTEPGRRVKRPVIRVPGRILTRIDPQKMDTTMIMHIRPGWEDLRDFIRGTPDGNRGWRPRFTVYVCTAAEREYALEVWRLLDPEAELIPHELRKMHFTAGMLKKDIASVLRLRADPAHLNLLRTAMPLAVILDDRIEVWDDHSQPHILQVKPFSPNNQAAAAKSATVHDPIHYNRAAEELKAITECLRGIRHGIYLDINQKLKAELAAAKPFLLADIESGRVPVTKICPCVRNHFDPWKQRRRDARQIRAALKESGQQADLISENTGAQSMSMSRRHGSSRAQQNGSSSRPEQEAQSARTPGRLKNGEASLGIQKNKEDKGAEAVADPISGEPLQEASSNGAAEDAPAHEPGPASAVADALAPRLSGNSSVQLGSAAESEAAPPPKSKAIVPPGLPKRLRDRPRDMPGMAPMSRKPGREAAASARGRALPVRGQDQDALHESRAAPAALEPQPLKPTSRLAKPSGNQPTKAAVRAAQTTVGPPSAQDGSTSMQKEEPPDVQAEAEASEAMPQASANASDVDITGVPDKEEEHASATSAASEPAGKPEVAESAPEAAELAHESAPQQTAEDPEEEEAPKLAQKPSKKRKVAHGDTGPSSKKHGVSSVRDASGRWRWQVPATDSQQEQTFPLDEEAAAAEAADKSALMVALGKDVLPQLNISLAEHVVSIDPVIQQTARAVLEHFQPKVLPRKVHAMLAQARHAVTRAEAAKAAARQKKQSPSPAKRKRRKTPLVPS